MIRGLIFDFDGLILDTEGPVYQSWVELYREFGEILPFDLWASIIGTSDYEHFDPFDMLEKKTGRSLDRPALRQRRYNRELEMTNSQPILPGVSEKLAEAKDMGLKLGVASSSSHNWVGGHLERLGLIQFFEVIHTSDDVERTKPDPTLFRLALSSLGLQSQEAIVFEDSPNGVTAAKTAGIFTVAVPNPLTRSLSLDHADLRLVSLDDLSLAEIIHTAENSQN
jgi:HAD superfamily hydrolase (TIGR01509 family)